MTCIVGLVENGNVYIGGDSAGVAGLSITIRSDEKVFENGPFIMGFTTSFRMGQLLRYKFEPPKQTVAQSDMQYMVTDFIDAIRVCFTKNGFGDASSGGTFLVGYNGVLYHIDSDYQVGIPSGPYDSVGCGSDIALGAMYASGGKTPEERVKLALEASAKFSGGVAPPFTLVKQVKKVVDKPTKAVKKTAAKPKDKK
jgi:ATP-dependent protease HslVU (ClpYQ) peptidase subunit